MDAMTLTLAVLLAIAVLGQFCLPLLGGWNRRRQLRILRERRACLLEDAADRQLHTENQHKANLGNSKGGGDEA